MGRRHFLFATAGLTAGTLTGYAAPKDVLKIVSSLPRIGRSKVGTDPIVSGIKLALAEHNGEAGGVRVKYLDWDDADRASGSWTADGEANNAQKAAADPDVVAYIGPYNRLCRGRPVRRCGQVAQTSPR